MEADDVNLAPQYVMRDNDRKFTAQFDAAIEWSGAKIKRNTPVSPNLRAHVKRFIKSLKYECLYKFIIFGKRHLDYLVTSFVSYYNVRRSHMNASINRLFVKSPLMWGSSKGARRTSSRM